MQPERRIRDAALLLPLIGTLIFLPPYIRIFDQDATLGGVPILFIYIFLFWLIGIVLTALVARHLVHDDRDRKGREPPSHKPPDRDKG